MIQVLSLLMLWLTMGHAQPVSCSEDAQCSEGFYCDINQLACAECLHCKYFNREAPANPELNVCVKSAAICGPCFEGLVNFYKQKLKTKCVPPEYLESKSMFPHMYWYLIAAISTLLIVSVFVYVWQRTEVSEIVTADNSMIQSQTYEQGDIATIMPH